jgi:hypothetical protein
MKDKVSLFVLLVVFISFSIDGCERPNPYKLAGDTSSVYQDCPTPKLHSSSSETVTSTTSGKTETISTTSIASSTIATTGSGNQSPIVEHTELDDREVDYAEALRTASLLIINDLPMLGQIYELGDLSKDQQKAKYEEMIDKLLNDSRFASTLVEFYRYTFKMGGPSTTIGEPTRETAPTLAARIVYEEKDWRNVLTQESNTCPTFNSSSNTFVDGNCNNLPAGFKSVGVLTDPGIQSLYFGNLSFRRNRFFHETFLCRNGNEQAGGEPTDVPPQNPPCSDKQIIPGYQNKWPVDEIAGACNGGRIDFHAYNANNICANCHATWNHRAPLFSQFDSKGVYQMLTGAGEYAVFVPVPGSPKAKLSDWLCVDPSKCPNNGQNGTAWKKVMKVDGVDTSAPASNLAELGQQMSKDDEVLECTIKRIWNYAMGHADITEVGGRNWVNMPNRNDPNSDLLTMPKLRLQLKNNGYNLKKVFRTILVSDDFVRF